MSTVLCANYLLDGEVVSDQSDKYALHKHLAKLDRVCQSSGLTAISAICDSTDMRVNFVEIDLPPGMKSTNELMARDGVWTDGSEALQLLERLLNEIREKSTRFGLFNNDHQAVVTELSEAIEFAKTAAAKSAKFNFSFVM